MQPFSWHITAESQRFFWYCFLRGVWPLGQLAVSPKVCEFYVDITGEGIGDKQLKLAFCSNAGWKKKISFDQKDFDHWQFPLICHSLIYNTRFPLQHCSSHFRICNRTIVNHNLYHLPGVFQVICNLVFRPRPMTEPENNGEKLQEVKKETRFTSPQGESPFTWGKDHRSLGFAFPSPNRTFYKKFLISWRHLRQKLTFSMTFRTNSVVQRGLPEHKLSTDVAETKRWDGRSEHDSLYWPCRRPWDGDRSRSRRGRCGPGGRAARCPVWCRGARNAAGAASRWRAPSRRCRSAPCPPANGPRTWTAAWASLRRSSSPSPGTAVRNTRELWEGRNRVALFGSVASISCMWFAVRNHETNPWLSEFSQQTRTLCPPTRSGSGGPRRHVHDSIRPSRLRRTKI